MSILGFEHLGRNHAKLNLRHNRTPPQLADYVFYGCGSDKELIRYLTGLDVQNQIF